MVEIGFFRLLTFRSFRVDRVWYGWRKRYLKFARPVILVVEVAMTQVHRKLVFLRLDVRHSGDFFLFRSGLFCLNGLTVGLLV